MNGDAIRDGYDHAAYAVGFLAGALLPVLYIALCIAAGWWAYGKVEHRARVWRLHRDARRSGRTASTLDLHAAEERGRKRVDDALARARSRS